MRILHAQIFVICVVLVSGNDVLPQLPAELQKINTPEALGRHFQEQLTRNETRFLISKQCFRHVIEYVRSLLKGEFWALQMFDSSSRIPSGFLQGNLGSLGAFDQCINIKSENKDPEIKGKYCLGEIHLINMDVIKIPEPLTTDVKAKDKERWLNFGEGLATFPWGICLPDACSAKDFQFLHFLFFLRFREDTCQTLESQDKEFDDADIGALWFFGIIGILMIISTVYDIFLYYRRKGKGSTLLRSFSILTNGSKIITIKNDENDIGCLHGLRVLNIFIVIAGIRYASYVLGVNQNWIDVAKWWLDALDYVEAFILIDTFFVISGMLISYNYLKAKSEGAGFNIIIYYLNRIVRLTPGLAAIILLHATLLRHIGSGPIWTKMRAQYLTENCREHWLSALFYFQNYDNPIITQFCVLQSWQLSVDMHLFLLSPLILIPLTSQPRYTLSIVGFLLLCSIVSPFLACWVYRLKAIIKTSRSLEDLRKYVKHFYFPTHTRTSGWIIGFIVGYLVFEARRRKFKIHKGILGLAAAILWVAAFGLIAFCVLVGQEMIGKKYDWLEHALYMAFIRPVWAIAIGWIIFACANGYGGPINSFLSLPFFQVLSRVSYGTYLTFLTMAFALMYQTRTGLIFDNLQAFQRICGDMIFSFGVGFVWTLAFESPFVTIIKTILGRYKKNSKV